MKQIKTKNTTLILSIAGVILSTFSVFSFINAKDANAKSLSINLGLLSAGLSAGSFGASYLMAMNVERDSKKLIETSETEIKRARLSTTQVQTELKASRQELEKANTETLRLAQLVTEKETLITELQSKFEVFSLKHQARMKELDEKLAIEVDIKGDLYRSITKTFSEDIRYRIDDKYESLARSVEHKLNSDKYSEIHGILQNFKVQYLQKLSEHRELLNELVRLEHTDSFITDMSDIYFQISDEITSLKVRYRNLLNTTVRRTLEEYEQELEVRRNPKEFVAASKVKTGLDMYQSGFQSDLEQIKLVAQNNHASLSDLRSEVSDLIDQIDQKNLEIANLKSEINKSRMPLKWSLAQSNELKIGNLIIDYFWNDGNGLYLDRSFHETDNYTCNLYFQIDRNPRQVVEKELNEHSEALQQYCKTIKPIEFSYSGSKGLMVAKVVLREKAKVETTRDEISRVCKPHQHFKALVSVYERWRVTGGSQAGKSPTAQMIADSITESIKTYQSKPVKVRLFNPQANSKKDNWKYKVEGKDGEGCLQGYQTFSDEIKARQSKKSSKNDFHLFIFDELDSVVEEFGGAKVKPKIAYGIKQGSHQDVGCIIIGQSSAANILPKFTWSDWNNVAQLHIGENAKNYIEARFKNDSEALQQYMNQFKKVKAYFEKLNADNGLKVSDYGYYRFAFVAIPNHQPTFVELPPFLFSDSSDDENLTVKDDEKITDEESLRTPAALLRCNRCSSENIGSKSNRYVCLDCGATTGKHTGKFNAN